MLLIPILNSIVGPLLLVLSSVSALPVVQPNVDSNDRNNIDPASAFANKHDDIPQQPRWSSSFTQTDDSIPTTQLQPNDIDDADFYVDLNRFTQLLSAHIMAEHLENAVTTLSKALAAQIQDSVQLIRQQRNNNGPYNSLGKETVGQQQQQLRWIQQEDDTDSDVDVRLLKEQLQGAVGSYVEDQLPNMWYSHSSFVALDSISLRSFMETTLSTYCPLMRMPTTDDLQHQEQQQQQQQQRDNDDVMISFACLRPLTRKFSTVVDNYIKENMHSTLVDIVQQDLPQLLIMTDNHIRAVLNHFNTFLLPPHSQLRMDLLSVQQDHHGWTSVEQIGALLDSITNGENNNDGDDDSLPHSIHQYAIHAKTSYYP
ncbi:hypothetical protein BCR42DRAFT_408441 [Absidia repens]|uniref:Uncharacterized protein n=1 Tax=Absidia repens TaxID=90262 RepID=A0A1X2IPV2_9FUNG|nr:hypothetical protein BCR42DRAFT_408441 [Absidia repens]